MTNGHLTETRIIAAKIYSCLPDNLKSEINLSDLQQAAMLHDYGKVLVPKEILNKKGALTPKEKEIMELHSEFGYELLKQQGVNERVLNLIKYHHQKPDGKGYPIIDNNYEYGISTQVLAVADMYSALREDRSYHKARTKKEALEIIFQEAEKGAISKDVYKALETAVIQGA